jgi:hypothetical protein
LGIRERQAEEREMGILQKFVGKQVAWSRMIERRLPAYCVVDGNRRFQEKLVPAHL